MPITRNDWFKLKQEEKKLYLNLSAIIHTANSVLLQPGEPR